MTGFITASGENYLLELISGVGYTLPSYFIALIKDKPPTRDSTGDELDEPQGAGYARAYYENASGNWTERVETISNTVEISFPQCQDTPWGQIRYWALLDLSVGGRVLWAGPVKTSLYVDVGDQVVLSPGSLALRTSGAGYGVSL